LLNQDSTRNYFCDSITPIKKHVIFHYLGISRRIGAASLIADVASDAA